MISDLKNKLQLLTPGHHGCFFYNDQQDAVDTSLVFLKIGLERNERCLFLSDPSTIEKTRSAFERAGIDTAREAEQGRLVLFSERDYLVNGRFDQARMIQFIGQAYQDTVKAGFTGMRGTGDVAWELGGDIDMEKLGQYEKKVDKFLLNKKATLLCQYNLKTVGTEYLRDSLFCHNAVVEKAHVCTDNHFHNSLYDFPQSSFDLMCKSLRV